jgi:hypothetical protein
LRRPRASARTITPVAASPVLLGANAEPAVVTAHDDCPNRHLRDRRRRRLAARAVEQNRQLLDFVVGKPVVGERGKETDRVAAWGECGVEERERLRLLSQVPSAWADDEVSAAADLAQQTLGAHPVEQLRRLGGMPFNELPVCGQAERASARPV